MRTYWSTDFKMHWFSILTNLIDKRSWRREGFLKGTHGDKKNSQTQCSFPFYSPDSFSSSLSFKKTNTYWVVTCVGLVLGIGNTRQISPGFCPQGAHSLGRKRTYKENRVRQVPQQDKYGCWGWWWQSLRHQVGHKGVPYPGEMALRLRPFNQFLLDIFTSYQSNTHLLQI